MKKLISLLLAVVMVVGILAGVSMAAYEKPAECGEADAGIVVTHSGDTTAKYFFENLTKEVISWACHDLAGEKVITLLKDIQPVNPSDTSSSFINIPSNMGDWEGRKGGLLTFDLNGKTITFQSQSNFINVNRYGLTIKNGTILYTCVGANRCPVMIGGSKTATATTNGTTLWTPKVVFDNMEIYVLTEGSGGAVFQNYIFGTEVTVRDSLLYTNGWNAVVARQTSQSDVTNPYKGDYVANMTVTGSTIISRNNHAIAAENEACQTA